MNSIRRIIASSAVLLSHFGIIDETRGKRIADIAWPRVVTGLARTSQRTADIVMVGLALGPAAIAGMGFALAYWSIAIGVGFSLANGGMTFFAQRFGANDLDGMNLALKQTLWIELFLAGIFTVVYFTAAEDLIRLLDAGPDALIYGSTYLQIVVLSLSLEVTNQLSSRALVSANDAWTPMTIRAGGAVLNIFFNAIFIFGLGLGVFGAALGTIMATIMISATFAVGFLYGRVPILGEFPIRLQLSGPQFNMKLTRQILEVGSPLMARRIVSRASRFFMLAIVAQFGTIIVAAYVASREIRAVMNTPGWGFGTAARSLVGQELGRDDEEEATEYGWDILRFSMAVYLVMASLMFVFARPISAMFTNDPSAIDATIPFVMVMAVSLIGLGIDSAVSGIISAGGDTRWPLYGRFVGLYAFMIPISYLGIVTPLGVIALYIGATAETVVPAIVTFFRFNTNKWIDVSRRYRKSPTD